MGNSLWLLSVASTMVSFREFLDRLQRHVEDLSTR